MDKRTIWRVVSLFSMAIGFAATALQGFAADKEQDAIIEEKVHAAIYEKTGNAEES